MFETKTQVNKIFLKDVPFALCANELIIPARIMHS